MRRLATLVIAPLTTACVAHYDPPLPPESSPASIPLSLGVVAEGTDYPDEEAQDAAALLDRTGAFSEVASASTIEPDLVVVVTRYPPRGHGDWCHGDNSIALALLTAGLIPACGCSSGYLMEFSAAGSSDTVEFRFEHEACSWVGWIPLFWNARADYHWYGGPDEALEAAHLASQLTAVQEELTTLGRARE